MKLSKILALFLVLVGIVSLNSNAPAQDKDKKNDDKKQSKLSDKELREATKRVNSATEVMNEVMKTPDKAIPKELLDKAEAVIVFPGVLKAAFIVGGRGGEGVVVRRTANGWSAPAFLNMGGASFGAQIGGEKIDYVMLVMNVGGLEGILQDKFEFGGEASVAAGPVGRTAAASTNTTLDAAILTYSRSQGAFAGVALKGAVISQDQDLNRGIYGKDAKDVLLTNFIPWTQAPAALQVFPKTVASYASAK